MCNDSVLWNDAQRPESEKRSHFPGLWDYQTLASWCCSNSLCLSCPSPDPEPQWWYPARGLMGPNVQGGPVIVTLRWSTGVPDVVLTAGLFYFWASGEPATCPEEAQECLAASVPPACPAHPGGPCRVSAVSATRGPLHKSPQLSTPHGHRT